MDRRKFIRIGATVVALTVGALAYLVFTGVISESALSSLHYFSQLASSTTTQLPGATFNETFDISYEVKEASSLKKSSHKDWWVSSGGYLFSESGEGRTIRGDLDSQDERYRAYRASNPTDTVGGKRPQNVFRLVNTGTYLNTFQEVYGMVTYYDPAGSQYRNASNGILLFNRYQDANNLYYIGVRVDGGAVIKKKYKGHYYTLAYTPLFQTNSAYDRDNNPNVLPLNTWIGIRSIVKNIDEGVLLELYVDKTGTGVWTKVISIVDDGKQSGPAIMKAGHGGIRTDFMDVYFDDYTIEELNIETNKDVSY